jgi:hypothetical protein
MFDRAKEYLKFGAGRPLGTIWSMEKAYFDLRRKYPGREEHAYLRLALHSRYPEKGDAIIKQLAESCETLDDIMVAAIKADFGDRSSWPVYINILCNSPACSRCGKYRSLSTIDTLCYGCRTFPGFVACTNCRLHWDNFSRFCSTCGRAHWSLTDGPGVPIIPIGGA